METQITARGASLRLPTGPRPDGRTYRGRLRLMRLVLMLQEARDQVDSELRDAWQACEDIGVNPLELYAFAAKLDGDEPTAAEAVA